jgi:hypothetical protein
VRHQARHSRRKAQAFHNVLTKDTSPAQHDGLSHNQRQLIDQLRAEFGWSEEKAREELLGT